MADRQEKIERLRKRLRAAPDSKAFAPLADELRKDGQVEEALGLLEDGLARFPDYLTAMVILGHTLVDSGRADHARKVLVRVLDLDPDNFVALRLLALDAFDQDIWHLALPWLDRLVKLEPENPLWAEMLLKARLDAEESGQILPAEVPEEDGFATMTMVDIYINQGYFAKALAALKLIQSRDPGRIDVKTRLAEVLTRMDSQGNAAADGQPSGHGSVELGSRRKRGAEKAAKRIRDKEQFNAWIDSIQPEEGNHS